MTQEHPAKGLNRAYSASTRGTHHLGTVEAFGASWELLSSGGWFMAFKTGKLEDPSLCARTLEELMCKLNVPVKQREFNFTS